MRRRYLGTNTRLIFRNDRIEEIGNVNVFFLQFTGKFLRYYRIIKYDRNNGVIGFRQGKVRRRYLFTELTRVRLQTVTQFVVRFDYFQYFDGRGNNGRCQRVGEQVRTRTLAQLFNYFFARRGIIIRSFVQRFIKRIGDNIDSVYYIVVFMGITIIFIDKIDRVGVVYYYQGIIFICQIVNVFQVGNYVVY